MTTPSNQQELKLLGCAVCGETGVHYCIPLESAKDQRIAKLEDGLREARENLQTLDAAITKVDPAALKILYENSMLNVDVKKAISTIDALLGDTEVKK